MQIYIANKPVLDEIRNGTELKIQQWLSRQGTRHLLDLRIWNLMVEVFEVRRESNLLFGCIIALLGTL